MKHNVLILILVASMSQLVAQNDSVVVRPLTISIPAKTATSLYVYMESRWGVPLALFTANNNNTWMTPDTLQKSSFSIGMHSIVSFLSFQHRKGNPSSDFCVSIFDNYINHNCLALNIGYTYEKDAYEKDRWNNAGFQSHWLTLDALLIEQLFSFLPSFVLGGRIEMFLGASTVSNDGWDYNGINPDCYKRITFTPIVGFRFPTANFFLDITIDVGNKLNKDKIMYVNGSYSFGDSGEYVHFRFGYRFFTPAKKTL